jgi:CBS domain-containing protein
MMVVKDVMERKTPTVVEGIGVRDVCRLLSRHKISGIAVTDKKGGLVGFVSERDIIAAVPRHRFLDLTAGQLMTKKVKTLAPDEPLANASRIFSSLGYRHIPVVRKGRVVGMVSRADLIEHLLGSYY